MKHVTINALVDTGCLLTFIPSLVSGLVLYLVLLSGGGRGDNRESCPGIARVDRVNIHNNTSLLSAALRSSVVPRIQQGICINKAEQRAIIYR